MNDYNSLLKLKVKDDVCLVFQLSNRIVIKFEVIRKKYLKHTKIS